MVTAAGYNHKSLILYYMSSLFYQVMGSTRCPKVRKHSYIKLKPVTVNASAGLYKPGDSFVFVCESNETKQTIKCLDDGNWNELPTCPDPTNNTCPEFEPTLHGAYNGTGPFKVGTVVAFNCDFNTTNKNDLYNLTGFKHLKCLPTAKWNHPQPNCVPYIPEPESNIGVVLATACLVLIPILIILAAVYLFIRWRKKQQQRARWKQYFTDYKYRHSKTSITYDGRPQSTNTVPVTDL